MKPKEFCIWLQGYLHAIDPDGDGAELNPEQLQIIREALDTAVHNPFQDLKIPQGVPGLNPIPWGPTLKDAPPPPFSVSGHTVDAVRYLDGGLNQNIVGNTGGM